MSENIFFSKIFFFLLLSIPFNVSLKSPKMCSNSAELVHMEVRKNMVDGQTLRGCANCPITWIIGPNVLGEYSHTTRRLRDKTRFRNRPEAPDDRWSQIRSAAIFKWTPVGTRAGFPGPRGQWLMLRPLDHMPFRRSKFEGVTNITQSFSQTRESLSENVNRSSLC